MRQSVYLGFPRLQLEVSLALEATVEVALICLQHEIWSLEGS